MPDQPPIIDIIDDILRPHLGSTQATSVAIDIFLALRRAKEATETKEAGTLAAALGLIEALEFYADPETYFAISAVGDPPCGDFLRDVAELSEEDQEWWDDYRPGGGYYGKKAREALAAWRNTR